MKIFNRELKEYEDVPEVHQIAESEEETAGAESRLYEKFDMPTDGDFIWIPNGSNDRIMKNYLTKNGNPITNISYVEAFNLIQEIKKITGKKYRLPTLYEIVKTYYEPCDEQFDDSVERMAELTADIIIDGKEIVRTPANLEIVSGGLKIDGTRHKIDLKISRSSFDDISGYVKKWNKWGLPEKLYFFNKERSEIKDPAVIWKVDEDAGTETRVVIRSSVVEDGYMTILGDLSKGPSYHTSDMSLRLVEVVA